MIDNRFKIGKEFNKARKSVGNLLYRNIVDSKYLIGDRYPMKLLAKRFRTPLCNISEIDDSIVITFELPGMNKDDIKLEIYNNTLYLVAQTIKIESVDNTDIKYHKFESSCSSFSRSFTLPKNIDANQVYSKYKNGILTVIFKKRKDFEHNEKKEIKIQ